MLLLHLQCSFIKLGEPQNWFQTGLISLDTMTNQDWNEEFRIQELAHTSLESTSMLLCKIS